jgi:hypothetical protein
VTPLLFLSFLLTFLATRAITRLIRADGFDARSVAGA